jgi:hypothetical protein
MADVQHKDLTGADLHVPKAHTIASHSDVTVTGAQVDDAVGKRHNQQHGLASSDDHIGLENGADGLFYVSNASGLPYILTGINSSQLVAVLSGVYVSEQTSLPNPDDVLEIEDITDSFCGEIHIQSVGLSPGTGMFSSCSASVFTINHDEIFWTVKDTGGKINIYYEDNVLKVQNKTAGQIDIKIVCIGRVA